MNKIAGSPVLRLCAALGFLLLGGCASGPRVGPGTQTEPVALGKTFSSLQESVADFRGHGFVLLGRFEQSQWPATVVRERDGLDEIRFVLPSGTPHLYTGYDGYLLKVVVLVDAAQNETVLVFRSRDQVSSAADVHRRALPPGMEMDSRLDDLVNRVIDRLAAQKNAKVAVLAFSDPDGSVSPLGRFIAEELNSRLVRSNKVRVVEQRLLDRAVKGRKAGAPGMVDQRTAKTIGRLSGADAVLIGTVLPLETTVRIDARLIATETGTVSAAASTTIPRDAEIEGLLGTRR